MTQYAVVVECQLWNILDVEPLRLCRIVTAPHLLNLAQGIIGFFYISTCVSFTPRRYILLLIPQNNRNFIFKSCDLIIIIL